MKINFYLKEPKGHEETLIYVSIHHNDTRSRVYTDKKINPKDWNPKDQRARQSFTGYASFNSYLKKIEKRVLQIDLDWKNEHGDQKEIPPIPIENLKDAVRKYLSQETKEEREVKSKKSFWGYYDLFLSRMERGVRVHSKNGTPLSPKTIFQFHNLKRQLQVFEKSKNGYALTFENIDLTFYNNFLDHLTQKLKLSPNTIGKLITNIKVFMREAYEEGLTTNNVFTYRKFKTLSRESDTVYLDQEEIKEIKDLDLTKYPAQTRVRDMFIIGCFTGLRYSDLIRINPKCINDGFIELKQAKTGGVVFIPISRVIMPILEKYGFKMPVISNQKYNEHLSLICAKCELLQKEVTTKTVNGGVTKSTTQPKHKLIGSHTARRSFATNEFKAGDLTISEIMELTGHKTEKSFYKYIRETPRGAAERIKEKFRQRELRNHLKAV